MTSVTEISQKEFWEAGKKRRSPAHPSVAAFVGPKLDYIEKVIGGCHANKPMTLLDVGAGNGYFSYYFEKRYHTVALDFSEQMLSINPCRNKVLGTAEALPFTDNAFDIVFCSNLLHHLQDPAKAIAEMKRVSRQYVILSEPNRNNPLMFLFGLFNRIEKGSLNFSLQYLIDLARNAELNVLNAVSLGAILPNKTPLCLLTLLKKIDGESAIAFYNLLVTRK